jgi:hypothetical protein
MIVQLGSVYKDYRKFTQPPLVVMHIEKKIKAEFVRCHV